jgi:hypothetical protein
MNEAINMPIMSRASVSLYFAIFIGPEIRKKPKARITTARVYGR